MVIFPLMELQVPTSDNLLIGANFTAVPVPVKETVCGLPETLSEIESFSFAD